MHSIVSEGGQIDTLSINPVQLKRAFMQHLRVCHFYRTTDRETGPSRHHVGQNYEPGTHHWISEN